jgi:hypothetical protein
VPLNGTLLKSREGKRIWNGFFRISLAYFFLENHQFFFHFRINVSLNRSTLLYSCYEFFISKSITNFIFQSIFFVNSEELWRGLSPRGCFFPFQTIRSPSRSTPISLQISIGLIKCLYTSHDMRFRCISARKRARRAHRSAHLNHFRFF